VNILHSPSARTTNLKAQLWHRTLTLWIINTRSLQSFFIINQMIKLRVQGFINSIDFHATILSTLSTKNFTQFHPAPPSRTTKLQHYDTSALLYYHTPPLLYLAHELFTHNFVLSNPSHNFFCRINHCSDFLPFYSTKGKSLSGRGSYLGKTISQGIRD